MMSQTLFEEQLSKDVVLYQAETPPTQMRVISVKDIVSSTDKDKNLNNYCGLK